MEDVMMCYKKRSELSIRQLKLGHSSPAASTGEGVPARPQIKTNHLFVIGYGTSHQSENGKRVPSREVGEAPGLGTNMGYITLVV